MDSFNPKKAELIALAEKHKAATEIEIIDKETYEQVHSAQIVLRDTRNDIKNQGLAIRENANKFIKQVTAAEKELLALITPTEDILIAKKEEWKKKEDEKKEAERKQQEELVNNRVQELAKYGYVHDLFELKIMEDEKFDNLLSDKKTAFENAQAEKEKERNAEERKNERQTKIAHIGMYYDGMRNAFIHPLLDSIFITREQVSDADDEQFNMVLDNYSKQITEKREEQKKAQEELDRKKKEQDDREAELKKKEDDQKAIDDEKKRQDDLEKTRKQAEKDTEDRIKKEADDKKKAEDDAKKAEEIRIAKEKKYKEFLKSIGYTEENKHEFKFDDLPEGRVFYKKVGIYLKAQ